MGDILPGLGGNGGEKDGHSKGALLAPTQDQEGSQGSKNIFLEGKGTSAIGQLTRCEGGEP